MRQRLYACLMIPILAAVAEANIRDVRDVSTADQTAVFIGFDRAPAIRQFEVSGQDILVYLDAPTGAAQTVQPIHTDTISNVSAGMTEMGYQVRVGLPSAARDLDVVPTQTGIVLRWNVSTPQMAVMTEEMPTEVQITVATPASMPAEPAASNPPVTEENTAPIVAQSATNNCATAAAAIQADPWDIDALTEHGGCLIESGSPEQAIEPLERVVAFEPGRFSAVMALAQAREQLGETAAAAALYEQAANVAATDGEAVAARSRARRLSN